MNPFSNWPPRGEAPQFIPAADLPSYLLVTALQAAANIAIDQDKRITVVGWTDIRTALGDISLCMCGCEEGNPGTYTVMLDTEVLEAAANEEAVSQAPLLHTVRRSDGRTAVILPAEGAHAPW